MSACLAAVQPASPAPPPGAARAARLNRFKREQLIVGYLNRGVSVAEIAAHIGVGEKRTRAVIREILARRMPHPPAEFVAIQVSRLNEAMLIAFSAMSPTNLKAVDQVVKIVRELDRYGGAFAAEWRRPEALDLDAPADGDAAFVAAWLCGAEPAPQDLDRHRGEPQGIRQDARLSRAYGDAAIQGDTMRPCSPGSPPPGLFDPGVASDDGRCDRPGNPPHSLEKVESTPGLGLAPAAGADARPEPSLDDRMAFGATAPDPAGAGRPENSPQSLEKVESAPGTGWAPEADAPPDLTLFLSQEAPVCSDLAARWSPFGDAARRVAPQHEGGEFPPVPPAGDQRPEIPLQPSEKFDSAPEPGELSASGGEPLGPPSVPMSHAWRPVNVRMTLNGMSVC